MAWNNDDQSVRSRGSRVCSHGFDSITLLNQSLTDQDDLFGSAQAFGDFNGGPVIEANLDRNDLAGSSDHAIDMVFTSRAEQCLRRQGPGIFPFDQLEIDGRKHSWKDLTLLILEQDLHLHGASAPIEAF